MTSPSPRKALSLFRLATAAAVAGCAALVGGLLLAGSPKLHAQTPPPAPAITVVSTAPTELNPTGGGAGSATLAQAAAFAWQEFIALNWPAKVQNGTLGDRDTPAADCKFGDPACVGRPLTWQTYRGKAEIFTNGDLQTYDTKPTYADLYALTIGACSGVPSAQPAWVNLDETTQISLAAMYAGIGPSVPTAANSAPQLVRFMAKANRAEFNYANLLGAGQNGLTQQLITATVNYVKTVGDPPPGGTRYVSLPTNTIELKAGWRPLNSTENAARFHTTKVRYYETTKAGAPCYNEAVWALVSLHIIQKTASAPYFIFATFEQADNILTQSGARTEDADGAIIATAPCRSDQTAPCPVTPTEVFNDTAVVSPSKIPPNVTLSPAKAAYCTGGPGQPPQNQAYYLNAANKPGLDTGGYVCVNSRALPIPPTIIAANKTAHAAIAAYNQANGIKASPWAYYKLVNVQYAPFDKAYSGPYSGPNPAGYYLSNVMVETNRPLRMFSGSLVGAGATGSNSDYDSQFNPGGTGTHKNVYFKAVGHDQGGCMGCHGAQGQAAGGDFSVILVNGPVTKPEGVPPPLGTQARVAAAAVRRPLAPYH
jgi:hypothetical protein